MSLQLAKVSANTATTDELVAALTAAGVPNAAKWRVVKNIGPTAPAILSLAGSVRSFEKYNPGEERPGRGCLSVLQAVPWRSAPVRPIPRACCGSGFGLALLGIIGTAIELVFLEHWDGLTQQIVAGDAGMCLALLLIVRQPTLAKVWTARALLLAVAAIAIMASG